MTQPALSAQRIVARFRDGRVQKGATADFNPGKTEFHVQGADGVVRLAVAELKAVFFVRSLEGDRFHVPMLERPPGGGIGRRIEVVFEDGEVLTGYSNGIDRGKRGFFIVPADPECNNLRVFVVAAAVRSVRWVS